MSLDQEVVIFAGEGEMRALCRALDWSATPLGPVASWTHSLRTTVATLLASRHPMFLFWGPQLVQVYNDAYRPSLAGGGRHPRALGMRGREFWTDTWDIIGPQIDAVMTRGESTWHVDQLVPIERNRRMEEAYWTYSYSPVLDDDGSIGGTLVVCQETTERVLAARRITTLHRLAALRTGDGARDTAAAATRILASNECDVPFALCFLAAEEAAASLLSSDPESIELVHAEAIRDEAGLLAPERWDLRAAFRSGMPRVVGLAGEPGLAGIGPWPEAPESAVVVPLAYPGSAEPVGALVLGLSPRLPWDEPYEDFARAAARDLAAHLAMQRNAAERERLAHALHVERARLEYVFRKAPSFLAVSRGPEHVLVLVNDEFYRVFGHRDVIGKPVFEALPEARGQGFEQIFDHVYRTGEPFVGREVPVKIAPTPGAPLEEHFGDLTFVPLVEADGTRTGIIGHGSDITEYVQARREAERLLRVSEQARADAEAARAEAEHANRAKAEFLATMSHELRTPLNAITGYVQLLDLGVHGPLSDEQRSVLARIDRAERHLLGLINDVLNYARIESGRVEYELEPVLIADVAREVLPLVEPLVQAKGLSLDVRLPEQDGHPPLLVWADREKLGQVLLNLLSNAVKFTPPRRDGVAGRILVELRESSEAPVSQRGHEPEGDAGQWAELRVSDTGIGIPATKHEAVFEPFVQVRSDLTREAGGTGLGLAISRDLAEGMGGALTVESQEGVGSTFILALRRVTTAQGESVDRRSGQERRVAHERRSGADRRDMDVEGSERD
ncbi:MAG TPA: ATP-binding protein [Longimicrobiales bacterium]|nr:ATP-binding protein [Longimicrobiales bacterium]